MKVKGYEVNNKKEKAMNKQELIEKLKGEQQRCDIAGSDMYNYITPSQPGKIAIQCKAQARAYKYAIILAQQLDEPSRGECEIIETERNDYVSDFKCSKCKVCFDLFRWVYAPNTRVNYCPNCGSKIKRR